MALTGFSLRCLQIFLISFLYCQSAGSSSSFTSSPPAKISAKVGVNVTLTWRFTVAADKLKYLQEAVVGTRSAGDNAFVRLVSVSRIGSVGRPTPSDGLASLQKRLIFVGNASLYRLSEFVLTNVQPSDDDTLLLCALIIHNQYSFSSDTVLTVDSTSSGSSSSTPSWIAIVAGIVGSLVVLLIVGFAVYKYKETKAQRTVAPQLSVAVEEADPPG